MLQHSSHSLSLLLPPSLSIICCGAVINLAMRLQGALLGNSGILMDFAYQMIALLVAPF